MNIFGFDIFGLRDCVSLSGGGFEEEILHRESFNSLVDAVLPEDQFGLVKTGEEAEEERIHTGLAWPPESKVSYENSFYLRRIPISLAWKILVESGDRSASWEIGKGVRFPVEKIIAKRIEQKIKQAKGRITLGENNHEYRSVVAIPDHLDAFGKEAILRALPEDISEKTNLLWRPIAAALAWLDKYNNDISIHDIDNPWVLVGYLGADGIEFTPLRLINQPHNDENFIVPVRDRPTIPPGPTGIDWQANVIENLCNVSKDDPGAFWQIFTDFPELWLALSQSPWDKSDLPRPWSKKDKWDLWMPEDELRNKVLSLKIEESEILRNLLSAGPDSKSNNYNKTQNFRRGIGEDWSSYFKGELASVLKNCPKGKLLGFINCGPLTPSQIPSWIRESTDILNEHGLEIQESDYLQPSMKLWLDYSQESIARGTRIFGRRLLKKQPTYFDTLPELGTLVNIKNDIGWVNLIKPGEHKGGELYKTWIKGKFSIQNNESSLKIYLKKEDKDWREQYSPLRYGKIKFKSIEHQGTLVDIRVEMNPTKGMARIELVPKNRRLGIKALEYSIMQPITEDDLPKSTQAWPDTKKIPTATHPSVFNDVYRSVEFFMQEGIESINYMNKLDSIRSYITKSAQAMVNGRSMFAKIIDQDGIAVSERGRKIIGQIKSKLDNDFQQVISRSRTPENIDIPAMITRGTWLWGETPESIIKFLEEFFSGDRSNYRNWNRFADAASRCFTEPSSYKILFKSIRSRIEDPEASTPFPINASRAIEKILIYREDGQDGLDENTAKLFVKNAIQNIETQVKERNHFRGLNSHQKFWRDILLFLGLIRFRKTQNGFLDANQDRSQFEKIYKCLENAYELTEGTLPEHRRLKFLKIRDEIEKFQHKRGNPELISFVDNLAESDGQDTNELSSPSITTTSLDNSVTENLIPEEELTISVPEDNAETDSGTDLELEDLERQLEEAKADLEDEEGGHDSYAIELIKDDIEYLEGEIKKIKNQN